MCAALTLVPSVFLGVNQGYVSDEHDGFNHAGARLEGIWTVSDHLEFTAYAASLVPLDDRAGESLRDLFWGGGAVVWSF